MSRMLDFLKSVQASNQTVAVVVPGVGAQDGKITNIDDDMLTFVPDNGPVDYVMHVTHVCLALTKSSG